MTNIADAREQLSGMTEITEKTIAQTLHRDADLDALYRECPTAFWLAPDADLSVPPAPPHRSGHTVVTTFVLDHQPSNECVHGRMSAVWRSLLAAGPIFAATGLMLHRAEFDQHWWDPFARALASLIAAPLTVTVGALLALLPILAGVFAMSATGSAFPVARRPIAWGTAGGVMGLAIAALFDVGSTEALALVTTSVACAWIARTGVEWDHPSLA